MAKAIAEAAQVSGPMGRSPPGGVVRIMIRVLLIEGGRAAASEVVASLLGAERTAFAVTLEPTAAEATLRLERETFDVVLTSLDAAGGVQAAVVSALQHPSQLALPEWQEEYLEQAQGSGVELKGPADDAEGGGKKPGAGAAPADGAPGAAWLRVRRRGRARCPHPTWPRTGPAGRRRGGVRPSTG